jgi:hypothetical protein
MHKQFVKTTKAKSEGIRLSNDLKRMLSCIDGLTSSIELLRRLPPNLRPKYSELLKYLLDGGYITESNEEKTHISIVKTPDIGERTYKLLKLKVATSEQNYQQKEHETISQIATIESNMVANDEELSSQMQEVFDITENQLAPTPDTYVESNEDSSEKLKIAIEKHAQDAKVISDLKLENTSLMELLTDAYVQINALNGK